MKNILDRVNGRLRTLVSNKLYSNYGQMDEDKVISGLFNNKKTGFFVDIGANHPYKINNTYKFYLKGWRGINIEPISENVKLLKKYRPKDKTLQIGISDKRGFLTFYQFNDHVLSTFSKKLADEVMKDGSVLVKKSKIMVRRLDDVFDEYVKDKHIDLLSVDTEGFDLKVLKSNNWKKYKPTVICVECGNGINSKERINELKLKKLLEPKGYFMVENNGINAIFRLKGMR